MTSGSAPRCRTRQVRPETSSSATGEGSGRTSEDIIESTGRQLRLARLLGRTTPPRYLHHPLVTDASGRKLSKKEFAKSLGDLRREGWSPERVLGAVFVPIAFLGGLTASRHPIGATEIQSLFR